MNNGEELVRFAPGRTLTPVMNLTLAKSRLAEFQQFVKEYMVEGEDYGQIPGTQKPTLYKPGADKLCELFGLADSYKILNRLVDFESGLFDYEIECSLTKDGGLVATGLGCCSSFEGKYRWRDSKRICPQCGKDTIAKGKQEYGGGWYCNKKAGGCGATFKDGDASIEGQITGRMENDDLATIKNTVFKIAKKRAKLDATLSATRSGGQFTQDIGDNEGKKPAAPVQQPQRKSAQPKPTPQPAEPVSAEAAPLDPSEYPDGTAPATQPEPVAKGPTACPKCGASVNYHETGNWGPWYGCSAYKSGCKWSISQSKWDLEQQK